jgi:type I restriction enzyme S subunit
VRKLAKVVLKDVVMRVKDKVDKDNTSLEYYVGGEHIDGNEICVTKKGIIQGSTIGPAFHMAFKAGDVLLMSRNPHLRKASMVDFDGICSDVSYICRTKDENVLLQSYLPFIMQTDDFWRFAEENKKGGLPFFLNWSDFERYEFELPSIEKQKELSDILWAMQNTKMAYRELLAKTDDLVKSQFIEMTTDTICVRKTLAEVSTEWFKGQPLKKEEMVPNGKNFCIHYGELFTKYHVFIDEVLSKTNTDKKKVSQKGDILFPASDVTPIGLTKCSAIFVDDTVLGGDIIVMRPVKGINATFLSFAIRMQEEQLLKRVTGSVVRHISSKSLQTVEIPIPSKEQQDQFEILLRQSDKSKFELKQAIENIDSLMKSLMKLNF